MLKIKSDPISPRDPDASNENGQDYSMSRIYADLYEVPWEK